jgi:hypothetical protein
MKTEIIHAMLQMENMNIYYIHKVWIWGILQSDWFSTSRILAHILHASREKQNGGSNWISDVLRTRKRQVVHFLQLLQDYKHKKKLPQIIYRLANEFFKF